MLVFLFIFTLSAILIFGTYHYLKQLRKQMIFKLLERNLLCNLSLRNWYSSTEILRLAKELNKYSKESLSPIFMNLRNGDLSSLIKIYQKDSLKLICGKKVKTTNSLIKAELSLLNFDYKKAFVYAKNLRANNDDEKARLLLIEAKIALNEGDMDTASRKTALAIKLFQKLGFIFEEASAYLLYGTIYRATGISDTAQVMLQTSAELFRDINAKSAEAEVYGNIGMLMVMDKRFDEANDYFEKAITIFETIGDIDNLINIYNQKALTMLINNNLIQATNWIKKSLSYCHDKNIRGLSVCHDIYAQIVFAKKQYAKAISLANNAINLYIKTSNISAKLEMMYLIAQAQIKQEHFSVAEKTLRKIIDEAQHSQSCFHIANAYSLLGVLFLQKKEFSRAKGLFNQSLQSELNNERWCGAAVDYANIALTEYRRGRKTEGNKNKIAALKYAEESGDEELITSINSALNIFEP